jgi:hypothetical protein
MRVDYYLTLNERNTSVGINYRLLFTNQGICIHMTVI